MPVMLLQLVRFQHVPQLQCTVRKLRHSQGATGCARAYGKSEGFVRGSMANMDGGVGAVSFMLVKRSTTVAPMQCGLPHNLLPYM